MVTTTRMQLTLLTCMALLLAGCSTFRGLPTHGGGKRFDEEQRIVAGAIRQAVADMHLEELKGQPVQIIVDSMSHNGGGYMTFPGIQSISGGYNENKGESTTDYDKPNPLQYTPSLDMISRSTGQGGSVNAAVTPNLSYGSSAFPSDADLLYLTAALNMKARHNGITVVPASPQMMLYVMVDVLGTNRSRRDGFLFWRDELKASCDLTYYALNVTSNTLLFEARQTGATGKYEEDSLIMFTAFNIDRELNRHAPLNLPVDGVPGPFVSDDHTTDTSKQMGTPIDPEKPLREFIEVNLRDADVALQQGKLEMARRHIEAVRAVAPSHPGMIDLQTRVDSAKAQNDNKKFGWLF